MPQNDAFMLTEAAEYAFRCQDVYPDQTTFAAAIPDHLKPIFLVPVRVQFASTRIALAQKVADGMTPTGNTPEGELFSYQTFKYEDNSPTVPNSDPGSIFENDAADDKTHHQEYNFDQNIQAPSDTTFNTDVDTTQYTTYPYRTPEKPVRKSSVNERKPVIVKLAVKEEYLKRKTPENIRKNAETCTVRLITFDPKYRVFKFKVSDKTGGEYTVEASLSDTAHISMNCNCPFWRYNGPEYQAKKRDYLLGQPIGKATKPDVRDPDQKYWLCKHTYAILKRMQKFIKQIIKENLGKSEEEIMETVDAEYYRLEPLTEEPISELEQDEIEVETDWDKVPEAKYEKMAISATLRDLADW